MSETKISGLSGGLIRFSGDAAQVYPCTDPTLLDLPKKSEAQIDLYFYKHAEFSRNATALQSYFRLNPTSTAELNAMTRRSEFRMRDDYLTITMRFPVFNSETTSFDIYSMSLLLFAERLLLVIPDSEEDFFPAKIEELLNYESFFEKSVSVPQLATMLSEIVFRLYTDSLENYNDVLKKLEIDIIDNETKKVFVMTALVRKQNIFLQQTILPLKEMSFNMRRADSPLVTPALANSLHTMSDQIQRIVDSAGMLSEINSGLLDMYANAQASRMNEIMRTLTVFSVLTLPVSVISGFYGMNFVRLPGLQTLTGLLLNVFLMILLVALIFLFCKRKHIL